MPVAYHMTYVKAQNRWIKVYQGKSYSVSCKQLGIGPSKEGSWLAANAWWESKQREIDAASRPDPYAETAARIATTLDGLDVKSLEELIDKSNAAKALLVAYEDRQERGGT
ncbi:MAG TPA: hypothetical protein VH092_23310, partial [Urbifossiella sp.]|nr:hypothetical protein [Urbifossiella sp.]